MFSLGDWLVDPATRRVSRGAEVVRLSPKAMQVLGSLRDAGGRVRSRQALLDEVWRDVTVGEEVLTHAIAEIRKAFGDSARNPRFVETVHKSGYRLRLAPSAPEATAGSFDLENHAAYLDGCELFFQGEAANLYRAVELFSGVLEADPRHALAHAGLAKSLFFLDRYFGHSGHSRARAEDSGRTAVAIDPTAPDAQSALGFVLAGSGHHGEALAHFALALRLNPSLAETHHLLGRARLTAGDFRMAATMLERAATLRTDDYHALVLAAKARRSLKDEAGCRANLVRARRRIDDALQVTPDQRRLLCDQVSCMVELGETAQGVEAAKLLMQSPSATNYYLVGGLARSGETSLALDCLRAVVEMGWSHAAWLAHDPDVQVLRREPAFLRLEADLSAR